MNENQEPLPATAQGGQATGASRGSRHRAQRKKEDSSRGLPWYIDIPLVVIVTFFIIFLVQTFLGRVYLIPSSSMEPTLHGCEGCTGDRIVVEKVSYYFSDPEPGDVVVFEGTASWGESETQQQRSDNAVVRALQGLGSAIGLVAPDENDLVKRVIAVGGQTVSCQEGDPSVMVDGQPTDQSFVLDPPQYEVPTGLGSEECGGAYFGPITVPEGNVFVMGDNRTNSMDSRYHLGDEYQGTIPEKNIRGKVVARIFPLDRIGTISSVDLFEEAS